MTVTNEKLRNQLMDKDKSIATLQRTVAMLEVKLGRSDDSDRTPEDIGRQERDEIDAMHEALKRIAQEVINDADQSLLDDTGVPELSTSVLRARSPLRSASRSPIRGRGRSKSPRRSPSRAHSPGFADSTYSAVQAALNKRQLQVIYSIKKCKKHVYDFNINAYIKDFSLSLSHAIMKMIKLIIIIISDHLLMNFALYLEYQFSQPLY